MAASADIVATLAQSEQPVYGVSTGFGSLANTPIPAERREELQRALVRSHAAGMGAAGRARGRAGDGAPPRRGRWRWGSRARGPWSPRRCSRCSNAGITPVVPEHGSLGASGDLAPLAHAALALIGEGEVRDAAGRRRPAAEALADGGHRAARADGQGGAGADQRHRRHPRHAACSRSPTSTSLLTTADIDRGDDGRGAARHRPRVRRRPAGAAAAPRAGDVGGEPAPPAGRLADRREPPLRRPAGAGRLLAAVHAAGARRGARHASRTRPAWPAIELRSAIDNPMILPDGRVESCGNFHGAPLGFVCDFLAIAVGRGRRDRRAPHRPAARRTRSHGLPPFLTADAGRQLRDDDRPLHAGGDGGREPAAGRAGERRLAADERDAGGPRLDGLGRGPQAAPGGRQPRPDPRRRAVVRRPRTRPARAARARRRPPAPRWPPCGPRSPAPGPDRLLAPELAAAEALVRSGALLAATEAVTGPLE